MIIRKPTIKDIDALELLFQITRQETFTARRADEFSIGDYQKSVAEDEVWVAEKYGWVKVSAHEDAQYSYLLYAKN